MKRWRLLSSFILVIGLLSGVESRAQTVTLNKKKASLQEILLDIYRQTKIYFYASADILRSSKKVSINVKNAPLKTALDICFKNQPFQYSLNGQVIVVTERKVGAIARAPDPVSTTEQKEDTIMHELDKVQVIGYGTTTRRFSTGNISSVGFKAIDMQPVANPLLALQARVPGLLVTQTNGLPGSPINVQIRGRNSIAANNNPLYLIDGVPFPSTPVQMIGGPNGDGTTNYGSPMNLISPNDIQSIEILKDADATAIYGSRGANGVILVTTKKGTSNAVHISADINRGFGMVTRMPSMLNTQQYLQLRTEALRNSEMAIDANNAPDIVSWDNTKYTDWQDWFIGGTAGITRGSFSISGGSDVHKILLSSSFHNETTVLPGDTRYKRANVHLNYEYTSRNKRLYVLSNAFYTEDNNRLNGNINGVLGAIATAAPNYPVYTDDGKYYWYGSEYPNPVALLNSYYKAKTGNFNFSNTINYELTKKINFKVALGYNNIGIDEVNAAPSSSKDQTFFMQKGSSIIGDKRVSTFIAEPQVVFSTSILKSETQFLLGSTIQRSMTEGDYTIYDNFESDKELEDPRRGVGRFSDSIDILYKYISGFARMSSNWKNKYLLNINLRRDGSSRFGPGRQFGNFFSIGAAWIFSNEEFISAKIPGLTFGKLRASYGTAGNDGIADYGFLNTYAPVFPYGDTIAISPTQPANDRYKWEISKKAELAVDVGLLNNRIFLSVVGYYNRSTDMLLMAELPTMTGFPGYLANVPAVVVNKGLEIELSTVNIHRKNFKWKTYFNLSFQKNYLKEYPSINTSVYANQLVIGKPLDNIMALIYTGISPNNGAATFVDVNHNGKTDTSSSYNMQNGDKVVMGQFSPKWYGAVINSISFKNFEIDIAFQYINQQGYNLRKYYTNAGRIRNVWNQFVTGPYPAPMANAFKPILDYTMSSAAISNSSFFRLKNVYASYKIPLKEKVLQLYIQAQNVFTLSGYDGYDPETSANATLMIPPLKTVSVGAKIYL